MSLEEIESVRTPTGVDFALRKNLWKRVELVQAGVISQIEPIDIYGGVCSRTAYERVATNPHRIAWLLTNPTEDIQRAEVGFSIGLTNLIKFVSKEPNAETAGPFLKAMEMLWNRVHGPVVQRIDSRHAHVNMNKPVNPPTADKSERLQELKSKLAQTVDVTPRKPE